MSFFSSRFTQTVVLAVPLLLAACSEKAAPPASAVTAAPLAVSKYEGKIVHQPSGDRGKADGWYLVKDGKRHWIVNGDWLKKNGYDAAAVLEISSAEFDAIPEDSAIE